MIISLKISFQKHNHQFKNQYLENLPVKVAGGPTSPWCPSTWPGVMINMMINLMINMMINLLINMMINMMISKMILGCHRQLDFI